MPCQIYSGPSAINPYAIWKLNHITSVINFTSLKASRSCPTYCLHRCSRTVHSIERKEHRPKWRVWSERKVQILTPQIFQAKSLYDRRKVARSKRLWESCIYDKIFLVRRSCVRSVYRTRLEMLLAKVRGLLVYRALWGTDHVLQWRPSYCPRSQRARNHILKVTTSSQTQTPSSTPSTYSSRLLRSTMSSSYKRYWKNYGIDHCHCIIVW